MSDLSTRAQELEALIRDLDKTHRGLAQELQAHIHEFYGTSGEDYVSKFNGFARHLEHENPKVYNRISRGLEKVREFMERQQYGETSEQNHAESSKEHDGEKELKKHHARHQEAHGDNEESHEPTQQETQESPQQTAVETVERIAIPEPSIVMPDLEEPSMPNFGGGFGEDMGDMEDSGGDDMPTDMGDDGMGGGNFGDGGQEERKDKEKGLLGQANDARGKLNNAKSAVNNVKNVANMLKKPPLPPGAGAPASSALSSLGSAAASALSSLASSIGGAIGAIVATVGWPLIIGIFVALLIILLIIAAISLHLISNDVQAVHCGDFSQSIDHFQLLFYKNDNYNDLQNQMYHFNNHHSVKDPFTNDYSVPDSHKNDDMNAESAILNINCLLFGHGKGYLTGNDNFTTFGKLLLGDRLDPANGYNEDVNHGKSYMVNQDILFDDGADKAGKCFTTMNIDDKQHLIMIVHTNPEYCTESQFKYQVAESLSHVLLFQQEKMSGPGNVSVYLDFLYGPLRGNKLPVYTCSDSVDRPYGTFEFSPPSTFKNKFTDADVATGEANSDEKQRFCFGAMVGEYMTYPYYVPDARENTSTSDSTQEPTPSLSPSPSATDSAAPSPLWDYNTGKYKPYYEFARLELFDGQEMFRLAQADANAASCPFTSLSTTQQLSDLSTWGFTLNRGTDNNNLNASIPIDPVKDAGIIQKTFNTICLLYQSPTYVSLLGADVGANYHITISFNPPSGWGGYTSSITHVTLYDMDNKSENYLKFILIHELGHVLQDKNYDLALKAYNAIGESWFGSLNCPRDDMQQAIKDAKTDSQSEVAIENQQDECFSDALALYVTYPNYGDVVNIKNNPSAQKILNFGTDPAFTNIYTFLFNYVFGGVDYYDTGRSTDLAVYAKNLDLSIQRSCPPPHTTDITSRVGYVNAHDQDCLNSLDFHPSKEVVDTMLGDIVYTDSKSSVATLQCSGFVQAATVGIGADIGDGTTVYDASWYAYDGIPGYQWLEYKKDDKNFSIQAGDILIWDGHIAIAVYVSPDKSVDIAEANIYGILPDKPEGGVWIRKNYPYDSVVNNKDKFLGVQRKE